MKIPTLIALAALLSAAAPANAMIPSFMVPDLELPLILDSERALFLGKRSASSSRYSEFRLYQRLPTHNYEPVGLHLDTNPRNLPEVKGATGGRDIGKRRGLYPINELAADIAWLSDRNVLVGARVEKRGYESVTMNGTPSGKLERLIDLLAKDGVSVNLFDGATYVLVEAPGLEKEFPRGRTRAVEYKTGARGLAGRKPGRLHRPGTHLPTHAIGDRHHRVSGKRRLRAPRRGMAREGDAKGGSSSPPPSRNVNSNFPRPGPARSAPTSSK